MVPLRRHWLPASVLAAVVPLASGQLGPVLAPQLIATASPPGPILNGFSQCEKYLRAGRVRPATNCFAAALARRPENLDAAIGLAEGASRAGAAARAALLLDALRHRYSTAALQLATADLELRAGDARAARDRARRVLARQPEHGFALLTLAHAAGILGDTAEMTRAVGSFSRAEPAALDAFRRPATAIERVTRSRLDRVTAMFAASGAARAWRASRGSVDLRLSARADLLVGSLAAGRGHERFARRIARRARSRLVDAGDAAGVYVAIAQSSGAAVREAARNTAIPGTGEEIPEFLCSLVVSGPLVRDCLYTVTEMAWRRGHLDAAISAYRRARRSLLHASDFEIARFATVSAPVLSAIGRYRESAEIALRGVRSAERVGMVETAAQLRIALASVERRRGRLDVARAILSGDDITTRGRAEEAVLAVLERAQIAYQARELSGATELIGHAAQMIEARGSPRRLVQRLALVRLKLGESSAPADSFEELFDVTGRSTTSVLAGAIVRGREHENTGNWSAALQSYDQGAAQLSGWATRIADPRTRIGLLEAWDDLAARRAWLGLVLERPEVALDALETRHADRVVDTQGQDWRHLRGHLDRGMAVLAFRLLRNEIWALLVDREGVRHTKLDVPPGPLAEQVALWVRYLRSGTRHPGPDVLGLRIAAQTLGHLERHGWLEYAETIVLLGGSFLDQAPLDALPLAEGRGVYGDRYVWARSSSLTALEAAWHQPSRQPRAVAFAPRGSVGAVEEAGDVLRSTPGQAFLGRRATESDFVREAEWSSLIHFGGHAVSDSLDFVGGALALRPKGNHDGYLTPAEISSLDLRGAYVVLLGCETARRPERLDGPASVGSPSLSDAFLSAGSRAVIGNLWAVTEATARELAREFYAAGGPRRGAISLSEAKRAMRRRFPDRPDRWAGAVWEGLPGPAPPGRRSAASAPEPAGGRASDSS